MTQRLVKNTLPTLAHFRLYRLNLNFNMLFLRNEFSKVF